MSQHQSFKRVAVPMQVAQKLDTITLPAPTRGLMLNENEAFMQPGGALVCDNWKPTLRGVSLRGGCTEWCQLPETTPVISSFQYVTGTDEHFMFACNATKVYNVTTVPAVAVATGRTSGNYAAAQMSNAQDDWLIVVNDAGDPPLRYDGTSWEVIINGYVPPGGKPSTIDVDLVKYPGALVDGGQNLVYVCKYRNRFFFIERNSMNAWYLPLNSVGGMLEMIPLSGAATKGGKLLFCCTWSIDAGDGVDDKLIFMTNLGEIIVFTGGDPSSAANWRQEGRFTMSPPLGMNAHLAIGGDVLVATIDGILPVSGAITKDRAELELAALSRSINLMWREQAIDKRDKPWTFLKWDEYGAVFTTFPGDVAGKHKCLVTNASTGAHARYTGWDAMCWLRLRGDAFFGTQTGRIMQMDRTGYDDDVPYVATLVGGWEMFQSPSQTLMWRQARASFAARAGEPFVPQLSATTDYVIVIPSPPPPGPDPGIEDLWDEGEWDDALWDEGVPHPNVVRNTGWVSIGMTGFSHAPIVQVTVAQQARPVVDLINIAATFERAGVNV